MTIAGLSVKWLREDEGKRSMQQRSWDAQLGNSTHLAEATTAHHFPDWHPGSSAQRLGHSSSHQTNTFGVGEE